MPKPCRCLDNKGCPRTGARTYYISQNSVSKVTLLKNVLKLLQIPYIYDNIIVSKITNVTCNTKGEKDMNKVYGYCRISTKKQSIERQERNILKEYADAIIVKEAYTGTKVYGRKEFEKLLKVVESGDTIVFDSVSRMSRNADDGIKLYMELYDRGVKLVYLKEHYIDTEIYKSALEQTIGTTGNEIADIYIDATNKVIRLLAEKQIVKAFEQAEKEVTDLQERTKEGLETAKLNGKQIGNEKGVKLTTKKSVKAKEEIKAKAKDFGGSYTDTDLIKVIGIARNTYYKYKKELLVELNK